MNRETENTAGDGDGTGEWVGEWVVEWVVVEQFANGVDADVAQMLLESRGVPVILENREFVGMDLTMAAAAGWIKVLAPPDRATEAVEILTLAASVRSASDVRVGKAEALPDDQTCLSCGGAMPVSESACKACGWSYTETLTAEQDDVTVSHPRHHHPHRAQAPPDFSATKNNWSAVVLGVAIAAVVVVVVVALMAILNHL